MGTDTATPAVPLTLESLLSDQERLQGLVIGGRPADLTGDKLIAYIRDMCIGLADEAHEVLGEIGWKPWGSSRHVNRNAACDEVVDAMRFLLNVTLALQMDGVEFRRRWDLSLEKVTRRVEEGYEGRRHGDTDGG